MIKKNPFAAIARTYSGKLWMLWALALTQTAIAVVLLIPGRYSTSLSMFIGVGGAIVATFYYGSIIYYLRNRAQFAANRPAPTVSNRNLLYWTLGIVGVVVIVFVLLEAFVWRS
jgi:hypothetical protein